MQAHGAQSDSAKIPGLGQTISALLCRTIADHGDSPAVHVHRGGSFQPVCWRELGRDVGRLAVGLRNAGVQPGTRVIQVVENRYEWIICDLAILLARAVHVPVHVTLSGEQMAYQITHSGAEVAILSGREQAKSLKPRAAELATQTRFFALDGWTLQARHPLGIRPLAELTSDVSDAAADAMLNDALGQATADELATIMYTSGTTGEPKGVMLSHGNLASNAVGTAEAYGRNDDELRLCFLPLSHVYARTCDLYTWVYQGTQFALAQRRETIMEDCRAIGPTMLNGVPYFYEKVYRSLHEAGKADEPGVALRLLGGKVRTCFCGGAALPRHVAEWFAKQDLPVLEGYGLSETSPVISVSTPGAHKCGKVGRPLPGVEVKIAPDGEILTRGPHVMLGYWNDEPATREVLREGWLHTGDLGQLDEDGLLEITGRKKEILVTAGGKNVVPAHLEDLLRGSRFILQAMVVGEGRNYLAALIVPDPDVLRSELRARRIRVFSKRGAVTHADVVQLYREEIDRQLAGVSRDEQIGEFRLLERGFTQEADEITAKGSMRREAIAQHFAEHIDRMYGSE